MPCNVSDINITPPSLPPGINLGTGFAPSIPDLPFDFPEIPLENLTEIFNLLSMALPGGGILKPGLSENFSKDLADGVLSILEKFMPFLYLYSFFLPVLNMIICVIEVLCAIPNPFKLRRALRRLFRKCLPDFLSLFPSFALIAMLLSLLALILALIDYLIQQLRRIGEMLLINIRILSKAVKRLDNESILAITNKIGQLLCMLENIFVVLAFVGIIIDVIKSIIKMSFSIPPCNSSGGTDDDCCTPDVCPSFIRNNEEFTRTTGTFKYLNQAAVDGSGFFPAFFPTFLSNIRNESWQFFDLKSTTDKKINNITHAFDLEESAQKVFFPQGVIYNNTSDYRTVEYTFDMRLFYTPTTWGRVDPKGDRFVRIKNCIVSKPPYDGYYQYDNSLFSVSNGTIEPVAGLVYEDDGITPILIDGVHANLHKFIHMDPILSTTISPTLSETDGYTFENIEYTFKINHESLLRDSLITLGCVPDVAFDRDFINTAISNTISTNSSILAEIIAGDGFPSTDGVNQCINYALSKLRSDMTEESLAEFQAEIESCLGIFKNSIANTMKSIITVGFDSNKSSFEIEPAIQFTSQTIKVKVFLNDGNGISMCSNLNADIANDLKSKIKAITTLGTVDSFEYDGKSSFIGEIKSDSPGDGVIKIMFDNKLFTTLNNPGSIDELPSISEQELKYKFISSSSIGDENPRRDESDISRDISH